MNVKSMTRYAMAIAITFLLTAFFQIPALVHTGYINLGDTGVMLAGLFFGPLGGAIVGALGSSLADLFLSYTVYAPFTFVIKGIQGGLIGYLTHRLSKKWTALNLLIGGLWMVIGYIIAESILYGFSGAIVNIPGNLVQAVVNTILSLILWRFLSKHKEVIK